MAKRLSVVPLGAPLPTYIKEGGREEAGQEEARPRGGVLLQVGFAPPFPLPQGEEGKEKRERRKGGPPPQP